MISSSLLNLTIYSLVLKSVSKGPFLTFNSAFQLSIYQSYASRLFNPFFYNYYSTFGQLKISYSSFKQGLGTIFIIGEKKLDSECSIYDGNNKIINNCYAFFGCCSFDGVEKAIYSSSTSPYTVKIKKCEFRGNIKDSKLISLPKNEQLIIEDSFFLINSESKISGRGLFIYSESSSLSSKYLSKIHIDDEFSILNDRNAKSNLPNYFSLSRSYFGYEEKDTTHDKTTRDTISSTALFHDIDSINMTDIKLPKCSWGCCLGLNTEAMTRITFSKFVKNEGDNLIWIWNLPDQRYQKFYGNCFYNNNNVKSFIFVDKKMYIDNCYFDKELFTGFGDYSFSFSNTDSPKSTQTLTFDLSQLDKSVCSATDPTSSPTPDPTFSPLPTSTVLSKLEATPSPSETPPTPTQSRSPWATKTPMPSSTPTATPPYIPIAGVSAAVVFVLCLIIFLIVFLCREYRHKSSEDTINDNNLNVLLSGVDEKSYSSETDPLDLNTSSEDSFVL